MSLKVFRKLLCAYGIIIVFIGIGAFIRLLLFSKTAQMRFSLCWTQFWCRQMCRALSLRIHRNKVQNITQKSFVSVSNHLSYLDIIAQFSYRPMIFITSQEVRRTPGLGWICVVAGCEFVDRENPARLRQDLKRISRWIQKNMAVHYYPEATSGDGRKLLPFKRALFQLSTLSKASVLVSVLNYTKVNGEKMRDFFRDQVFWYGEMEFISHLHQLVRLDLIEIEIQELKILEPASSRELSENSFHLVEKEFIEV